MKILAAPILASAGFAALVAGTAPRPAPPAEATPAPAEAAPGRILYWARDGLEAVTPDGRHRVSVNPPAGEKWPAPSRTYPFSPRLSPDRTRAAFFTSRPGPKTRDDTARLVVRTLGGAATDLGVPAGFAVAWSPDGKELAASYHEDDPARPGLLLSRHVVINHETGKTSPVTLPHRHHTILDWLDGGRAFLTLSGDTDQERLHRVDRRTAATTDLTPDGWVIHTGRATDDGRRVAVVGWTPDDFDPATGRKLRTQVLLVRTDPAGPWVRPFGASRRVFYGVCWSPNGRRIAYGFWDVDDGLSHKLATADPDGSNERVLVREPHRRWDEGFVVVALDWR